MKIKFNVVYFSGFSGTWEFLVEFDTYEEAEQYIAQYCSSGKYRIQKVFEV